MATHGIDGTIYCLFYIGFCNGDSIQRYPKAFVNLWRYLSRMKIFALTILFSFIIMFHDERTVLRIFHDVYGVVV